MKKEKEMTFSKQFLKVLLSHMKALGIIFLVFYFMGIAFWAIHDIVTAIMEILILVVYVIFMASAGKTCAVNDMKKEAKTKAFAAKGVVLAIPVAVLNFAMWGALQLVHAGQLSEIAKNVMQTIFFVWTVPYNIFLKPNGAQVRIIGQLLMYIVPFLTVGIGYISGIKQWDVYEKLDKVVFEQKRKK